MTKTILLNLFFIIFLSCSEKNESAIGLYNNLRNKEIEVRKFDGYTLTKRGSYYMISLRGKKGFLVYDFKINNEHDLDLKNEPISNEQKEIIYELLTFKEEHIIVKVDGILQTVNNKPIIEFRTGSDEVLVYFDDPQYMVKFSTTEKSFKKIDTKWGYYLGEPLS
ncbi:hypothetical protein [Dyadobacter frigoris]|uniref:Lipoprotein n=1 Tax=Dyadobacter frigoris TaxID=2576211 RepID=A0A4U6CY22_9BACT|nr:hypothetical protein [Dyadobacter frigoris]TKT88621.1 hypothetical protein FDK13_27130 [Dyadobacter frigoris]GLU54955.1 hypothetical protein Dfri01_44160 [Dyadobacter frigoris]